MRHTTIGKIVAIISGVAAAALMFAAPVASAQVVYQLDSGVFGERFNNSKGTETEDNWVANSFAVVEGGTELVSIDYIIGENFTGQPVTAVIYQGVDVSDPTAGLTRLQTTDTTITGLRGDVVTITLDTPVDLNVGDVFYAALLIRGVTGDLFPFFNDTTAPQGQSFFDVGPTQGAPYDLDVTDNATVNGGTHPVVGPGVQSPGNTAIRVNATATP